MSARSRSPPALPEYNAGAASSSHDPFSGGGLSTRNDWASCTPTSKALTLHWGGAKGGTIGRASPALRRTRCQRSVVQLAIRFLQQHVAVYVAIGAPSNELPSLALVQLHKGSLWLWIWECAFKIDTSTAIAMNSIMSLVAVSSSSVNSGLAHIINAHMCAYLPAPACQEPPGCEA
jgi:hypothetical protein